MSVTAELTLEAARPYQFAGDFQTDFLSVEQITADDLERLHQEAEAMKWMVSREGVYPLLEGHVYDLVFWDSKSTRTKESFRHAALRLGAKVASFDQEASSGSKEGKDAKNETFESTIEMLDSYLVPGHDGIILRHNVKGGVERAADIADAYVINAGDGTGEHPTQAGLDTLTVRKRFAARGIPIEEGRVVFFGDVGHSRVVHSDAPLLATMGVRHMDFVVPDPELDLPKGFYDELRSQGVEVRTSNDFREFAGTADIIMAMRTQHEFMSPELFKQMIGRCLITPEMMEGSGAEIMHALPENQNDLNIHPALRNSPQCIVKEQAGNGQYFRMALLALQAGKSILEKANVDVEMALSLLNTRGPIGLV